MLTTIGGGNYNGILAASYGSRTQSITIGADHSSMLFRVLTENDIATKLQGTWNTLQSPYDENDPADLNGEILKLTEGSSPLLHLQQCFYL